MGYLAIDYRLLEKIMSNYQTLVVCFLAQLVTTNVIQAGRNSPQRTQNK